MGSKSLFAQNSPGLRKLGYRVHKLPDRHVILAQRMRAHDLDLLKEVHPRTQDDIRVEEDQDEQTVKL
jgi:hypothetical protein